MPTGISIHIGLNDLDERHYGRRFSLAGCLGDLDAMHRLADRAGFDAQVLRGEEATAETVLGAIRGAAARVGPGDILLVTYSGHGARVRDLPREQGGDEGDGWDETWCLFDREVVDDELYDCWADFPAGARILVISDSCFSGDVVRESIEAPRDAPRIADRPSLWGTQALEETRVALSALSSPAEPVGKGRGGTLRGGGPSGRTLLKRVAQRIADRHHDLYQSIQRQFVPRRELSAEVLLLSAAQDNETAADGERNGAFTAALLEVWNDGEFQGDYVALHAAIYQRLQRQQYLQHPQILALPRPAFARQRPFTI